MALAPSEAPRSLGYYDPASREWVSVSGTARISQDRDTIEALWEEDWKLWFPDEGGERDGGPDDPRLALIFVDARSGTYFKNDLGRPKVLYEVAKGMVTGERPDIGRQERLSEAELKGCRASKVSGRRLSP